MTSWNTVPEERKRLRHFYTFVFLGVHITASGVLEHVMSAVSVCIAETQSLSFIYFSYNGSKFSFVKKVVWVVHQL